MGGTTRTYRSELRQRQAGETRRRIIEAAGELFAELGYARTTLARIAERAGVSPETVQLHGPKAALLRGAIELAGFGVEGAESATELDVGRALLETPRDELPEAVGRGLLAIHAPIAGTCQALVGGAANDPELGVYFDEMVLSIRRQWSDVADELERRGWLRTDLPKDELVDTWCLLAGPEAYTRLVDLYGWSGERYADWVARTFRGLMLST